MVETLDPGFLKTYKAGNPQLWWKKISGDMETPVSAFLKLKPLSPYRALLESADPGSENKNRYSLLALDPDVIWSLNKGTVSITTGARETQRNPENPLDDLRDFIAASALEIPDELPALAAPVIGYLGFDCVRYLEKVSAGNKDEIGVPDAIFIRPKIVLVFDSYTASIFLITTVRPAPGVDAGAAVRKAEIRFSEIEALLHTSPAPPRKIAGDGAEISFTSNIEKGDFIKMVNRAKDYILAGDIFQVVLSQRFSADFDEDPFTLYRVLRGLNPSPFMFYMDFNGLAVTGSSPEILVRLRAGTVTVRPIAGTRPRGKNAAEDAANRADLLADKKELAEHLMLLDLGRNDVGRVSQPGSVKVTEHNSVEFYSHVMHIVSNVTGTLRPGLDALDALFGGFPAGTVSGAPKVRALEIIQDLESTSRGVYAGAAGYFSANGEMDTCIALRTAVIKDGVMHVQAGAGIVADSDAEEEWRECHLKAGALFAAAKVAAKGQA